MKLYYIEWEDAVANANWFEKDLALEWIDSSKWIVKEVGWVLKETKDYIFMASCWKPEDDNTVDQFKLLQRIPKTWIMKRIDLSKHIKEKKLR